MAGFGGYERLEVYRRAMSLLPRVNAMIGCLPDTERFELASQMRRASRSVPTNIAEGYAKRKSAKEFTNYLTTAIGSANEMEVHLRIVEQLGYADVSELRQDYNVVGRQLNRLIASWRDGPPGANRTSNQQRATSD